MNNDWTIDPTLGAREGFVDFEGLRTWYAVVPISLARSAGVGRLTGREGGV